MSLKQLEEETEMDKSEWKQHRLSAALDKNILELMMKSEKEDKWLLKLPLPLRKSL